jgi:hypothetical protein
MSDRKPEIIWARGVGGRLRHVYFWTLDLSDESSFTTLCGVKITPPNSGLRALARCCAKCERLRAEIPREGGE